MRRNVRHEPPPTDDAGECGWNHLQDEDSFGVLVKGADNTSARISIGRIAPMDSRGGSTRAITRIASIPNPPKPAFAIPMKIAAREDRTH
jgi:hypothetical protein